MFLRCVAVLAVTVMTGAVPLRGQVQDDARAAADAFEERRFDVAIRLLTGVIESAEVEAGVLGDAYWNRGISYAAIGDKARAFSDFQMFGMLAPGDADGQAMLVEVAVELKRYQDAFAAFTRLAELAPNRLRDRRVDVILIARAWQLDGNWEQADDLLERYAEVEAGDAAINVSRARTAAALGRRADAIALVRRSAGQHNLVLVQADKAFAALWDDPEFLEASDIGALYERELAQAERAAEQDPERLFPTVLRMSALWRLGRFEEAVRLGEQTLASDLSAYVDADYREAQVHEQLARSLTMMGDLAAAERTFRTGIERLAGKSETVVTLLMSAGQFLAATAGKYKEALGIADRADTFARLIYGSGIGDSVRALAYWGLDQPTSLNRILRLAEENISTSQSLAIDLFLLTGRRDDAAKLVVAQLADPARVDTMLVSLQRYAKNRPPAGAAERVIDEGWEALRSDPSVLAAVREVGRINDVPAANRF